jgi:hypothetical protein
MSNTYLYIFNFVSVSGTDPYESWGSLREPSALGFRLLVEDGTATNINTGECSIAQTYNEDTNETITYIVTDVAMEPYTNFAVDNIFFKSWDEEKTVMKERFGFPTAELNQGLTYTTADFSTLIEDGFATLLEQGTSSELPVATKFSKTNYTTIRKTTNLEAPQSIVKNSAAAGGQFFKSQASAAASSENTAVVPLIVSPFMGGY